MPLIYEKAIERRTQIIADRYLMTLEISGFVKCLVRDKCTVGTKEERIRSLRLSLQKQIEDYKTASFFVEELEALADLRNVAGLLFLELSSP